MKLFIYFISSYFFVLTALPTVRAIKTHFADQCQSSCSKDFDKESSEGGCQKEKCLLNFSFSVPSFIISSTSFDFQNNVIFIPKKENSIYHKNFISNYSVTIWQPPESFFLI